VTAAGGPFTWDYTSLNPTSRTVSTVRPAAEGVHFASFPGAELVSIGDLDAETYFDVTPTTFSVLGATGGDLGGGMLPFPTDIIFSPPLVQLNAPLTFPNVFTNNSSFNLAIAVADLPAEILDSLGVPTGLFDSIRIRLTIDRTDFVDAYGTLAIPGDSYDVLRVKRTDYQELRLEIHVPFLGWQDVTDLLGAAGFGTDTTITYNFLSNTAKEPIAVLTMDSAGINVVQADYKDLGLPSGVEPVIEDQLNLIVSPNPVSNEATFTLKNIEPGQYTLHLVNMNGQRVWSKKFKSNSEQVSLEKLSSGVYLYQLMDANQQLKVAGKIVKE